MEPHKPPSDYDIHEAHLQRAINSGDLKDWANHDVEIAVKRRAKPNAQFVRIPSLNRFMVIYAYRYLVCLNAYELLEWKDKLPELCIKLYGVDFEAERMEPVEGPKPAKVALPSADELDL